VKIRRVMAAGAGIASAVAVAIALESEDPARAVAPPPDGTYVLNEAGASGVTWTVSALCDQVNGSRYYKDYSNPDIMADFCSLNIVSSTPEQIRSADKLQNFSGRARLTGALWTFKVDKPDGVSCPGGGTGPTTETYAFDNETFAGTHTIMNNTVCGLPSNMKKQPFSLSLVGPPPSPIERYPLQCNDIAMCF
jgi:hypothetical protein